MNFTTENPAQGIYIHVPFCRRKCIYCDFPSIACTDEKLMLSYADAVALQIEKTNLVAMENATIYFGGGTPSLMPALGIQKIVKALRNKGLWQHPGEVTIECNPGTVNVVKLAALREMGFDRLSFGIQSLNDNELRQIGRIHTAKTALDCIDLAKKVGFKRLNGDLIYGLPGQTMASLADTLTKLCNLNIEHLSVYGLSIESGTELETLYTSGQIKIPAEQLTEDMYDYIQAVLTKGIYQRYEISNYAIKGGESKHNLVYWNYRPYAAFGAAATAFDGHCRFTGERDVKKYLADPMAYTLEKLTPAELYGEFMFMNLRKADGVNLQDFERYYGRDIIKESLDRADEALKSGLLIYDSSCKNMQLTEKGMALGNRVFAAFL